MTKDQLDGIFDKIKSVKIAIYGDFCLDTYWVIDPKGSEISLETGNQALAIGSHYTSLGGASNVLANVAALKPAELMPIGVIGNDLYGKEISSKINALGVDTSSLTIQENDFDSYVFTKKYLDKKEVERIDFGTQNKRSQITDQAILDKVEFALGNYDVVIINQQVPGCITNLSFIDELNKLFRKYNDTVVIVDSRHYNQKFENAIFKSNDLEIEALDTGELDSGKVLSLEEMKAHANNVQNKTNKPVFVTMGANGILAVTKDSVERANGVQVSKSIDTVGAGDTVLSAMALALGAGCSPLEAAEFANLAAGVTVQKLMVTGTANKDEISTLHSDVNYLYKPELAASIRNAKYHKSTDIEVCYDEVLVGVLGNIKHAVFDHDGTISTLREGWEAIMLPMMINAILGSKVDTVSEAEYNKVLNRSKEFIDVTTGIQTIVQMDGLVELVEEFAYVPKDQILDKFGYKKVYNDALLEAVDKRREKFENGELSLEDYTVKGAVAFLHAMKAKGIKLYLASGTDKEDVIKEAEVLGYADVFEGRIYGSVGDISKYSKKMVIDNIIKENNLVGNELVVFGDGPVEMQVCRTFGGIAVGIASDEVRRYGLNPDKRTRLIKAGAQILVSDMAQGDKLMDLLFTRS